MRARVYVPIFSHLVTSDYVLVLICEQGFVSRFRLVLCLEIISPYSHACGEGLCPIINKTSCSRYQQMGRVMEVVY